MAYSAAGLHQHQIGSMLGCSTSTVGRVIRERLALLAQEMRADAETIRAKHLNELREARARISPGILKGDHDAVGLQLKILNRESLLLGLDRPPSLPQASLQTAAEALLDSLVDRISPAAWSEVRGALAAGFVPPPDTDE